MTPIQQEVERRYIDIVIQELSKEYPQVTKEQWTDTFMANNQVHSAYLRAMEHQHSLAQQEIERLKGLVGTAFVNGYKDRYDIEHIESLWLRFKQQHNL